MLTSLFPRLKDVALACSGLPCWRQLLLRCKLRNRFLKPLRTSTPRCRHQPRGAEKRKFYFRGPGRSLDLSSPTAGSIAPRVPRGGLWARYLRRVLGRHCLAPRRTPPAEGGNGLEPSRGHGRSGELAERTPPEALFFPLNRKRSGEPYGRSAASRQTPDSEGSDAGTATRVVLRQESPRVLSSTVTVETPIMSPQVDHPTLAAFDGGIPQHQQARTSWPSAAERGADAIRS